MYKTNFRGETQYGFSNKQTENKFFFDLKYIGMLFMSREWVFCQSDCRISDLDACFLLFFLLEMYHNLHYNYFYSKSIERSKCCKNRLFTSLSAIFSGCLYVFCISALFGIVVVKLICVTIFSNECINMNS